MARVAPPGRASTGLRPIASRHGLQSIGAPYGFSRKSGEAWRSRDFCAGCSRRTLQNSTLLRQCLTAAKTAVYKSHKLVAKNLQARNGQR